MPVYKKVNKDFFKKWSPDMAYVLGFFAADGNLVKTKRGGYYLSFYSSDKNLLASVQNIMKSTHKLTKKNGEQVYRFQIGNKVMFNDLLHLGFVPNKIKRMKLPEIPTKLKRDFIRGYFDGDGNVWSGLINKKRHKPTKILQVVFTSGCKDFLLNLLIVLRNMGVVGGSIHTVKNKNCSRLGFSTLDSLKIFKIMYNTGHKLYLKRKKQVFEKFIKMRP